MPAGMVKPLVFVLLGVFTVLFDPLAPIGDRIGPGWGDLLNAGLGFVFFILAGVSAVITARRAKHSQPQ